jgi:methanogenic corrinoid protein MtbC1
LDEQRDRERDNRDNNCCELRPNVVLPHYQSLVRAVEGEIVPRLLLARRAALPVATPANAPAIEDRDADELARLLIVHEVDVPFAYAESIRYRGATTRDLYIRLLAPAARRLGEMWEQDECDFMQVTLGLGRLHQLLQRLSQLEPGTDSLESRGNGRRVLLATAPGETHSFGVVMVSHFFRQNGWDVYNEFPDTVADLSDYVQGRFFDLVGLSVSSESRLDVLSSAVRAVRRHSQNRSVGIMVGGSVFQGHPDWVARVGADATAEDGEQAARLAESVTALLSIEK